MMRNKFLGLMALSLLLMSPGAKADLLFNLTPAVQSGRAGDTLIYSATLQNTGASDIFINGDNFALPGTGLTLDDTPLFNLTPLVISAGTTSGSLALFDVAIDPTAASGDYFGSFSVLGGTDAAQENLLATQNFQITVVPEPGSLSLFAGPALLSLAWLRRRRAQS